MRQFFALLNFSLTSFSKRAHIFSQLYLRFVTNLHILKWDIKWLLPFSLKKIICWM